VCTGGYTGALRANGDDGRPGPAWLVTRTCSEQYCAENTPSIARCAAHISLAAMPSLRWVRSTASDVMCPCTGAYTRSLFSST